MSKYVCCSCRNVFDEDDIVHWIEDHGLEYGGEHWSGSPCCHENYVEAHTCDGCGCYIDTETYVKIGNEKFCENCYTIYDFDEI